MAGMAAASGTLACRVCPPSATNTSVARLSSKKCETLCGTGVSHHLSLGAEGLETLLARRAPHRAYNGCSSGGVRAILAEDKEVKLSSRAKPEGGLRGKLNKVVLAYSGGLDTSVIVPWLRSMAKFVPRSSSKPAVKSRPSQF